MKHVSLILGAIALVLLAVAQYLVYEESGWNAGMLLMAGILVVFNVVSYTRRS